MLTGKPKKLLTEQSANMKIDKNLLPTWNLSLAPGNLSGHEVCPHRTAGCTQACVAKSGNATIFPRIMQARIRKTIGFFDDRQSFLDQLTKELRKANDKCKADNTIGLVRLNTFSDVAWEHIIDLSVYDNLRFYDYTKSAKRAIDSANMNNRYMRDGSQQYRLCYSVNENSDVRIVRNILDNGGTVAVVFGDITYNSHAKGPMHTHWNGYAVVDGDATDDRYNDPRGCVIGLRLKGTNAMRSAAIASKFAQSVTLTIGGKVAP